MNPAEKYAALKLLRHGLDEALAEAEREAMAYARQTKARTLETDYGTVSLTRRKPSPHIADDEAFLAWCRENAPAEVVETVRPSFIQAFLGQMIHDDDLVIYALTGEAIDFVKLSEGKEYLTPRLTPEAKQQAADYVALNLDRITPPAVEP